MNLVVNNNILNTSQDPGVLINNGNCKINMGWHPKGAALLWKPELQETKFSQTGVKISGTGVDSNPTLLKNSSRR
jgi:hypothetical protein